MIIIPLVGGAVNADYTFQIQLGDNAVDFRIHYLTTREQWTCDLSVEGVTVATGVMLLCGDELLQNYNAGIGRLVMTGADPTLDDLGTNNKLVWVSDNE